MIFGDHIEVMEYASLPIDKQVKLQIRLARRYARDFLDAGLAEWEIKEEIVFALEYDLKQLELYEKYEYCILYKDTIENIKYIPERKLY